ncbi:hypothetical protein Poly21_20600 [Allorhodopirellula heiligendammensis]|uniref:Uncharacterized protein n=1 Tax=Allorhodopirellula heiligendammensis TaxID=2714739 RepID=A0A5C6C8X6_9BACT|nr:hypothetical protein Poly21_20600 [Allorhodopirellula heiligendammensis]
MEVEVEVADAVQQFAAPVWLMPDVPVAAAVVAPVAAGEDPPCPNSMAPALNRLNLMPKEDPNGAWT